MSRVRGRDTKPELFVRSLVHRLGFRFRLHGKFLPGKPDLVFASKRKVVFVHGCFWHSHAHCKRARTPSSNREYWESKLARNRKRDSQNRRAITNLGWSSLVIWECQTNHPEALAGLLLDFLEHV